MIWCDARRVRSKIVSLYVPRVVTHLRNLSIYINIYPWIFCLSAPSFFFFFLRSSLVFGTESRPCCCCLYLSPGVWCLWHPWLDIFRQSPHVLRTSHIAQFNTHMIYMSSFRFHAQRMCVAPLFLLKSHGTSVTKDVRWFLASMIVVYITWDDKIIAGVVKPSFSCRTCMCTTLSPVEKPWNILYKDILTTVIKALVCVCWGGGLSYWSMVCCCDCGRVLSSRWFCYFCMTRRRCLTVSCLI